VARWWACISQKKGHYGVTIPVKPKEGMTMSTSPSFCEFVQSYRAAVRDILWKAWSDDQGQDIAEYAVMLAVILVIVVGTIRLIGSNANTVFSEAASSIQ
jgi:Flp pilus assembly pilin Flp